MAAHATRWIASQRPRTPLTKIRRLSSGLRFTLPPNGWPLSCGRHEAYHGRPTPGNPDHHPRSVAPTRSAVSFSGLLGGCAILAKRDRLTLDPSADLESRNNEFGIDQRVCTRNLGDGVSSRLKIHVPCARCAEDGR